MFTHDEISDSEITHKMEPIASHEGCLHHVFELQASKYPNAIAVSGGAARVTYSELNSQANQLAHHLRAMGVGPEVLVGLCLDRSIDAIVGMLGILKAGGAYVPLDPAYPQDRLAYMLEDSNVLMLITHTQVQAELQLVLAGFQGEVVYVDKEREGIGSDRQEDLEAAVSHQNLMYVIYTSGSTGVPKGIMVTHANVMRVFQATQPYLHLDKDDVWTWFHSYSFGFSVWEIWGALIHGASLVIVPSSISQSPDDFYNLVCQEGITVLSQTPSAFGLFRLADAASNQADNLKLRYVIFSGEPLDSTLLESWMKRHGDEHPQLINMYAITETAGEITYRRLKAQDLNQATRSVIGVPLPDVRIYLLDEDRHPVSNGDAGEMFVSSAAVARGYLNLPELTAENFVRDPFSGDKKNRMYKTGDRARYLPNGEIEFLGRVDDQVKIRGYRVEPTEVQAVLTRHAAIEEAAVVAQLDRANTPRLVAYVVPRKPGLEAPDHSSETKLTTTALQGYLKKVLPDYMIPSAFVKLNRLPRSPNGKVDRKMLPLPDRMHPVGAAGYAALTAEERVLAEVWGLGVDSAVPMMSLEGVLVATGATETAYVAPQSPVEKAVAQMWEEVLGRSGVGLHDDFLELGGNSLLAAQILYRANDEFKVSLSMRQLLDASTVSGFASLITQGQAEQVEPEELASILADLAEVSDEETQRILANQLGRKPDVAPAHLPTVPVREGDMEQHEAWMRLAIGKAKEAIESGQSPMAACIVKDGQVVACVYDAVSQNMDVTAHAEVQAIRAACHQLNTIDLSGCVLYSTLEPCPMCLSACHLANISKLVYGARRSDAAKLGFNTISVDTINEPENRPLEQIGDTLRNDNSRVLELWLDAKGTRQSQYDDIAEQFKQTKTSPVNQYIFAYSLFDMIGDLHGRSVLELACGEGHYSRMIKQRGAARVVGVDISSRMIDLAKQRETQRPRGIEYSCQDVMDLGRIGEFDLVVSALLLNHAQTKEHLKKMCQTAFDNLKAGGCFVLLNENPEQSPEDFRGYEQYGYRKMMPMPYNEGAVITYTLYNGTDTLQFTGHYWLKETYESAFEAAGFGNVQWRELLLAPEGVAEYGRRFWRNYIDNPPHIGIICRKK